MSDFYKRHNPNNLNRNNYYSSYYSSTNSNINPNVNSNVNREYLVKDLAEYLEIKAKAEAFDKLFDLLKDKIRRNLYYTKVTSGKFSANVVDKETYYFKTFTSEEVLNVLEIMKEIYPINFKYNLDEIL